MLSDSQLAEVFGRTKGHCHFCGDPLVFDGYGKADHAKGAWEIDHIIQKGKGGSKDSSNCLAACIKCNRLRWHRTGQEVRDLLIYGLIARDEIKKKTQIGKAIEELKEKRLLVNQGRRRKLGKQEKG
jgi:5-methylcytosine-specific restriction endonuclease McrA